jgi:8-oxo-dGTP diphosphatase
MLEYTSMIEQNWQRYSASHGVLIHEDRLLLVANEYEGGHILWSLPGGRLELGESHLEAVVREFREETGLAIVPQEFLYAVDAKSEIARKQFISLVFRVELADPTLEFKLDWETDLAVKSARLVDFAEAAGLLKRPSLGEALMNYLYFGVEKMPRRYWHYPEYLTKDWKPISFPPT